MLKNDNVLTSLEFDHAEKIVVFLHGYGSSWEYFPESNKLYLANELKNTVICAPNAPFVCDAGRGYQWFKLRDMSYQEIRQGLDTVATMLADYIDEVSDTYQCDIVSVVGFSQGAMLSFETLYHAKKVSKIVAYAGMFVPAPDRPIIAKSARVLIVHSLDDQSVPYTNANLAKNNLEAIGVQSRIITYDGIGHSISIDGLEAGVRFINETNLAT
ncbi:MAG: alpha/beta fold hydrolase [Holosporales bacterium]|nr:alpha/beta fold hydrolase [Holosporales bacterium]